MVGDLSSKSYSSADILFSPSKHCFEILKFDCKSSGFLSTPSFDLLMEQLAESGIQQEFPILFSFSLFKLLSFLIPRIIWSSCLSRPSDGTTPNKPLVNSIIIEFTGKYSGILGNPFPNVSNSMRRMTWHAKQFTAGIIHFCCSFLSQFSSKFLSMSDESSVSLFISDSLGGDLYFM